MPWPANIPADKIMMGITNYGYDWVLPYDPANKAATITLGGVWDIGRLYNAPIVFNDEVKQPSMDIQISVVLTIEHGSKML